MYRAIASVGTLLLNLGELSVEKPDTTIRDPAVENSSNGAKPVGEYSSNLLKPFGENTSNLLRPVEEGSSSDRMLIQTEPVIENLPCVSQTVIENSLSLYPHVVENLSNGTEPVTCSSNVAQSCSSKSSERSQQSSSNGSPLFEDASAQQRLCDALADAAADCAPVGHDCNTNDDEFIRVDSDGSSRSSPEVIDIDDKSRYSIEVTSNRLSNANADRISSVTDRLTDISDDVTKKHEDDAKISDDDVKVSANNTKHADHDQKHSDSSTKVAENLNGEAEVSEGSCRPSTTRRRSSGNIDAFWCITFEQFLASVLTEPLLVEYFEEQTDIEEIINTVKTEGVRDFVRDPKVP